MRPVLVVLLLLVVAGCGVRPSAVIGGVHAPEIPAGGVVLYFVADGRLTPALRPDRGDPFPLLAAGPTAWEREHGMTSDVPAEAVPTEVAADGDGVTLRLPVDVSTLSELAVQQLACTTTTGHPVTLVGDGVSQVTVICAL